MSQPISDTLPCAATCSRIELIPSRAAAVLWFAWLLLVCGVTLFAVSLPWPARMALCAAVAVSGIHCIRSFVLLQGPRAVRVVEWSEEGTLAVRLGPSLARHPALVAPGSFRLGAELWVLRFRTPEGLRPVLIAGGIQDTRAFRRLCRCLAARLRRPSGRRTRLAVTIPPKV